MKENRWTDMKVDLFDFHLPEELIAQTPLEDRTSSRLMIVNKVTGELQHRKFKDIYEYINPGDCLVLNDTRVLPARLHGEKEDTGAHIEVLLLKQQENDKWETLVKPAKRVKEGTIITFGEGKLKAVCVKELEHGGRILDFQYEGIFMKSWINLARCHCHHILRKSLMIKIVIKLFMQKNEVLQQHQQLVYILLLNC